MPYKIFRESEVWTPPKTGTYKLLYIAPGGAGGEGGTGPGGTGNTYGTGGGGGGNGDAGMLTIEIENLNDIYVTIPPPAESGENGGTMSFGNLFSKEGGEAGKRGNDGYGYKPGGDGGWGFGATYNGARICNFTAELTRSISTDLRYVVSRAEIEFIKSFYPIIIPCSPNIDPSNGNSVNFPRSGGGDGGDGRGGVVDGNAGGDGDTGSGNGGAGLTSSVTNGRIGGAAGGQGGNTSAANQAGGGGGGGHGYKTLYTGNEIFGSGGGGGGAAREGNNPGKGGRGGKGLFVLIW